MSEPDEAYRTWIRGQPCVVLRARSGTWLPVAKRYVGVQASHVRSWGATREDRNNIVPLDWLLHDEQHHCGIETFQVKYRVDLEALAREHTERYEREFVELPF